MYSVCSGRKERTWESQRRTLSLFPSSTMWVLGINLRSPGLAGGAGPAQQFLNLRTFIRSTVTKDHKVKFVSAISFIAIGHLLYTSHLCVYLICLGIVECLPVPLFLKAIRDRNFEVRILNSVQWRPKADRNASSGSFCAETAWAAPEGRHHSWLCRPWGHTEGSSPLESVWLC